jgi:dihydroorotate dehydrogenase electron transfer subunit
VGLAPFASLAQVLRARAIGVKLYYGARRGSELFYLDMFEKMGVELVLATEDGSRGDHGRVTVPLERDLKSRAADASVMLYACGPERMLEAVAKLSAQYGHPSQVSVERVMGCGVGGCYSCVIPIKTSGEKPHFVRSCLAGPVFRGSEISW